MSHWRNRNRLTWAAALAAVCCLAAVHSRSQAAPAAKDSSKDTAREIGDESGEKIKFTDEDLNAFLPSFVLVKFYFKRSEEAVARDFGDLTASDAEDLSSDQKYADYVKAKMPMMMVGVVVAPDLVVAVDLSVDERYLDHIEVQDLLGGKSGATRAALLKDCPGLLLRISDPARLHVRPVAFEDMAMPLASDAPVLEIGVKQQGANYILSHSAARRATLADEKGASQTVLLTSAHDLEQDKDQSGVTLESPLALGTLVKSPTLLLNRSKKPVGVALSPWLRRDGGKAPIWAGARLLADARVGFDRLASLKKDLTERFDKTLPQVKITFRQKAEDREAMFEMVSSGRGGGAEAPKEMFQYGLPVSPRVLFVPGRMKRQSAKVISTISVTFGGQEMKGEFMGAFKDIAAFLVRVEKDALPYRAEAISHKPFPFFEPLITARAERKYGGQRLRLNYGRALIWDRGYKEILEPVPFGDFAVGSFYVDLDGAIRGALLEQRLEDEDKEKFRESARGALTSLGSFVRLYTMSELAPLFASPEKHFDETIVWLPEEQEKRKMWLGVEFEPMTRDLAKSLGVEKATKDGGIGLLVSMVYPGSPAARIGLKPGDILLKISEGGGKEPIELKAEGHHEFGMDYGDGDVPDEFKGMGFSFPKQKLWRSQKSLISQLLEVIGEGKTVELSYLAGGRDAKTQSFKVEKAPEDFDSAPKHKDKELGLTVKNVTYEARAVLNLPKDFGAVVVAKVEEGGPAAVAKVDQYELIVRINDKPIAGVDDFKKIVEEAKKSKDASGKTRLRLTLQNLDRTRFADVTLDATTATGETPKPSSKHPAGPGGKTATPSEK